MFLNTSTGDDLRRIVVNLCACMSGRFCAWFLIVGLAGQTLVVGPLPRAKANAGQPPPPASAPPAPFAIGGGGVLAHLPDTSGLLASLFGFVAPKSKKTNDKETGFENAVLEPLRNSKRETSNSELSSISSPLLAPPPVGDVEFDFDGDNKADVGRWRGIATDFKVRNSNGGAYSTYTLGSSGAVAAPGDFNGNGATDAAVFSGGTWTYKTSPSANPQTISWGTAGDIPYAGDYDGDGTTDAAVYRPSTNTWWIKQSSDNATVSYGWGAAGDIPITGNWDGDSKTDIAVYRPSNGTWYIQKSSGGGLYLTWGLSYDIPVQGDYDGDGKSDVTVFRPTTGTWYILKSSSNWTAYSAANWGLWSDQPVPADYDGDGITDLAVWRPTDGNWYILKSTDNSYEFHTLGIAGDTAVPSSYTKQVGGTASGDVINAERVKPRNATGGTNLYSQNFGWGTSLVSLSGRAGLDAGFGIGYNSLLWLKVGNAMYFDSDRSNVTPGFQFGFPVIEPIYYDNDKQKYAYMMVTPSGSRIEFRQTAASNVYETADSSYTQLVVMGADNPFDPVENLSMKVTTTDGTHMTYAWSINSYKCTRIQDRNGNYISVAYDSLARLATMTDTLGRIVTVNYGSNGLPSTITQTWKDSNGSGSNVTHTWATFAYTSVAVDTDFATSLSVVGPPDGTVFTVLDKITYPDGSSTKFEYNDYLQVKKISSIAADSASHVLNYVATSLAAPSSAQTDCPRFTETRSWVENFNQNTSGTAQEVVVTNSLVTGATYNLPGSITGPATRIDVALQGHPDNLVTRTYIGASGYKDGLTLATEDCVSTGCTGTDRKRWTWTDWTQDDTSKSYITNPRVVESRVGDGTNTKRSTVEYYPVSTGSPVALYGLVKNAFVYDTDLTTVLKQTYAEYNLDTAYTSRRIIGLPSNVMSYGRETGLNLMSKVTYSYDEGNFSDTTLNQSITPVQHDGTNYSSSFITGRGNLTSTTRCDVTLSSTTTCGGGITSSAKYNTAGAVVAQITPWDGTNTRTVKIGYTDNFNSTVGVSTYAYPTTLTDPANNSSTVKYRYDIGTNVEATSPAPAGQTYGKTTKRVFDGIGRLQRNSIYVNTTEKSYTRYEYPTNGIQSQSYTPIVDVDGDGDIAEDEVYSESWFDGAGRVRKARTEHPGSTGGWSATQTEYDILGRVYRSSVPTEVSVSGTTWTPAGDDATRGWIWNYAYYDWKGRTVRTIPSDSNGSDGKDTLITYEGCGCAGGQVTTIRGPVTTAIDVAGNTQTTKRRNQKAYEDILGRTYKTEIWDLDGGGSAPYSTVKTTFNGRDQATLIREYAGADTSSTYQDTTATFDGHGRLATSHKPEQRDNNNNLTYTTYSYNPDDSISTVTDGRGAVTNYTYNSRALVTNMGWTVPSGSGIPDPTDVTFSYDNLGNRTQMTDGLGNVTYEYNDLSQMTAETRQFTDTLSNAPLSNNRFKLEYTYALSGQLKSYKDPYGQQFTNTQDKVGRMTAISANASFGGVTNYADNPQYRAWGALKHLEYGDNNAETNITYDTRLAAATFEVVKNSQNIIKKEYTYLNDGNLKYAQDLVNSKFDRLYRYDFADRVAKATTGAFARGQTANLEDIPYDQYYAYNAFGGNSSRTSTNWVDDFNFNYNLVNNRNQQTGWTYDSNGNLTHGQNLDYLVDAAGRTGKSSSDTFESLQYLDGDGAETKRSERKKVSGQWESPTVKYFIRSSVMKGEIVSEAKSDGAKERTYVYSNGVVIAKQVIHTDASENVGWEHTDVSQAGIRYTSVNNNAAPFVGKSTELDYLGNHVGLQYVDPPAEHREYSPDERLPVGIVRGLGGCQIDGIPTDCELVNRLMSMGATEYSVTQVKTQKTNGPPHLTGGAPRKSGTDGTPHESASPDESGHSQSQIETRRVPIVYLGAGLFGTTLPAGYDNEGPQWGIFVFSLDARQESSLSNSSQQHQSHANTMLANCPPYPDYPAGADLDANIRATRLSYMSANNNSPIETSSAFARQSAHVALFVARVKPGGDWDYKRFSTSQHNYEAFGNFHYGAVGGAAGFTLDQLLRAAGFVQQWAGDEKGDGGSVNIINALTGEGGQAPFEDQVRDQDNIKDGYSYYIRKFVLQVCK